METPLQLTYHPPFDWKGILNFLRARTLKGVEWVQEDSYFRTVRLGRYRGWISIHNAPEKRALMVEFSPTLAPVRPALLGRLRGLFDMSARPDIIAAQLSQDALLADAVKSNPGLRVPGAFDGFELAVRAILGQQVTVRAATTLAGRFAETFGEKIETPYPELNRLCPTPERIASAKVEAIAALGIVQARAGSIIALAREFASGRLKLSAGMRPDTVIEQLVDLSGIGQWTAHYIAMRALHWPDAFPKEDIAIRNNLGGVTAKQAEQMSHAWRPWRSYAVLHIWQNRAGKIK